MGCLHSKNETVDIHPNIFRVINVSEDGVELCSGQLEITDTDIILYREGRDSTVWPLHSLRRYGFEEGVFSFESGRRCETGEGIYGFRCRRAGTLFHALQHRIMLRNEFHDGMQFPGSHLAPSPQGRPTLHASVVHRSSIDNGQPTNLQSMLNNNIMANPIDRAANHSQRSHSSADILEVTPLYPRTGSSSGHVTNVYQVREFKREPNNNQAELNISNAPHLYTNDITRDLAILRNSMRQQAALNMMRDLDDENVYFETRYMNAPGSLQAKTPLSPTQSSASEHYAQLSLEQQEAAASTQQHETSETGHQDLTPQKLLAQEASRLYMNVHPKVPKQVEYCNVSIGPKTEINTYANVTLGETEDVFENNKQGLCSSEINVPESETLPSISPIKESEVNYAVLDMDATKETEATKDLTSPQSQSSVAGQNRGRLISQCSLEKHTHASNLATSASAVIGYTTIDFDKTVALTSVAIGSGDSDSGSRKTRHNSNNIIPGSPNSCDKNKICD